MFHARSSPDSRLLYSTLTSPDTITPGTANITPGTMSSSTPQVDVYGAPTAEYSPAVLLPTPALTTTKPVPRPLFSDTKADLQQLLAQQPGLYVAQFQALFYKCFFMIFNNLSLMLTLLLMPVLFVLLLQGLHSLEEKPSLLVNFEDAPQTLDARLPACKRFAAGTYEVDEVANDLFPCARIIWGGTSAASGERTVYGERTIGRLRAASTKDGGGGIEYASTQEALFGALYDHPGKYLRLGVLAKRISKSTSCETDIKARNRTLVHKSL